MKNKQFLQKYFGITTVGATDNQNYDNNECCSLKDIQKQTYLQLQDASVLPFRIENYDNNFMLVNETF